ncbi:hypothetical protein V1264_023115 [Littorina saxatilis]|uniref:Uncharacterized protein n=1 Tax=Littorina saxatilis TaxID=31220 RepID=A0AAN9BAR1_9CAEN
MAAPSARADAADLDEPEPTCVICNKPIQNGQQAVHQTEKGVKGLKKASQLRNVSLTFQVGQRLHKECRQEFCNANSINRDNRKRTTEESANVATLRSKQKQFDFAHDCLFCGQPALEDDEKKVCPDVYFVRSSSFQLKLLQACQERGVGDKWAEIVQGRLEFAPDLHAADAVYHNQCNVNFRTKKNVPISFNSHPDTLAKETTKGRPEDPTRTEAFLRVISYLEDNETEQVTVGDLCKKMGQYCDEPFSEKHMKRKLDQHFGKTIIITSTNNKSNIITFRVTAADILYSFSRTPSEDATTEKLRIVEAAAKLIMSDIRREMKSNKDKYPTRDEIGNLEHNLEYLPESVKLFLQTLMHRKKEPQLKIASLGQALVQATCPRIVMAPLQIGLAVQLHHLFGSRYLVDHLNKLIDWSPALLIYHPHQSHY